MNEEAQEVLDYLLEGNRRFAGSFPSHPHQDKSRRDECTVGQNPVAAIVGCADSRVPTELIFDCGIGDVFIVRNAGTVLDSATAASVEYAVDHLRVPLVIVLGHTSCGAVTAAIQGSEVTGALGNLLEGIRRDCTSIGCTSAAPIDTTVKRYTKHIARQISTMQPVVKPAVDRGRCSVVAACYSLESGTVEVL